MPLTDSYFLRRMKTEIDDTRTSRITRLFGVQVGRLGKQFRGNRAGEDRAFG